MVKRPIGSRSDCIWLSLFTEKSHLAGPTHPGPRQSVVEVIGRELHHFEPQMACC